MPDIAWIDTGSGHFTPWQSLSDNEIKLARRGYYAAVTGMDEQLGRVVDELERSGVANNTIIIFHSDHGWHLGEHGDWEKFTNFEVATRIPMSIRVPWMRDTFGTRSSALVEAVDIMPTLAELAGINLSDFIGPDETPLEGISIYTH
jgi:iduronate 2-sulfatase